MVFPLLLWASTTLTARTMRARVLRVTVLPELASRGAYGNARGIITRPFVRPVPVRHIGAVWRKTSARAPAIGAVAKVISEHAK